MRQRAAGALQLNLLVPCARQMDRCIKIEWFVGSEIGQLEVDVIVNRPWLVSLQIGDGDLSIINGQFS